MHIKLRDNERQLHVYRQTKFILCKPVVITCAAIGIPWYFLSGYALLGNYAKLLFVVGVIGLLYFFRTYIVWRLNRYIVTNQRVILISHQALFQKVVIETPLERILNISYKTKGFLSSLLKFGDVEVQVVGLMEPMVLSRIDDPAIIANALWHMHEESGSGANEALDGIPTMQERIGYTKKNQRIL